VAQKGRVSAGKKDPRVLGQLGGKVQNDSSEISRMGAFQAKIFPKQGKGFAGPTKRKYFPNKHGNKNTIIVRPVRPDIREKDFRVNSGKPMRIYNLVAALGIAEMYPQSNPGNIF